MPAAGKTVPALSSNELLWLAICILLVGATGLAMVSLHERHYRSRRERINRAREQSLEEGKIEGLYVRMLNVEGILMEDRLT